MIARIWTGAVRLADGDEYVDYINDTGIAAYKATPGNQGAWMLRRDTAERTEFVTLSFWDDMEAVKGFAGEDPSVAVFYPEDERFLVEADQTVAHYEIV